MEQPPSAILPAAERGVLPEPQDSKGLAQANLPPGAEGEAPPPPVGDRAPDRVTREGAVGQAVEDEVTPTKLPGDHAGTRAEVVEALDALDWGAILSRHEGWRWSGQQGGVHCPGESLLPLVRVEQLKDGRTRARFQAPNGACASCRNREGCIESEDPKYRKEVRLALPKAEAASVREKWLSFRRSQRQAPQNGSCVNGGQRVRAIWRLKQLGWEAPAVVRERSPLAVTGPTLLPGELRRATRSVGEETEVHVGLEIAPSEAPHPALAESAARRQQRRLSWEERLLWNALPAGSSVELILHGGAKVARLLDCPAPAPELAEAAC